MKNYKALILFLLFFSSTSLFSKNIIDTLYSKNYNAFKAGEFLEYKLHYGFFNASYASLELKEEKYNGYKTFRAKGVGKTSGLTRFFFKIDDYYDSYFLSDVIKPVHFIRNISEGNYKKHITIDFSDKSRCRKGY